MKLTIEGNPIPQRRPEVKMIKGKVIGYDPSSQHKKDVLKQISFLPQVKQTFFEGCCLKFDLTAYMPIPASLSKKKQKELENQHHIKRPDIDNIVKFYQDVLEGVCYDKDETIAELNATKLYSFNPRVEITIQKME